MKINKIGSSNAFDNFASNMLRYKLKKQAGNVLTQGVRISDDVAQTGVSAGRSLFKSMDELSQIYKLMDGAPDLAKDLDRAKEIADAFVLAKKGDTRLLDNPEWVADAADEGQDIAERLESVLSKVQSSGSEASKIFTDLNRKQIYLSKQSAFLNNRSAELAAGAMRATDEAVESGTGAAEQAGKQDAPVEAAKPEAAKPEAAKPEAAKPEAAAPTSVSAGSVAEQGAKDIVTKVETIRRIPISGNEKKIIQDVSNLSEEVGANGAKIEELTALVGAVPANVEKTVQDAVESMTAASTKQAAHLENKIEETASTLTRGNEAFKKDILASVKKTVNEIIKKSKHSSKNPETVGDAVKSGGLSWIQDAFRKGTVAGTAWKGLSFLASTGLILLVAGGSAYAIYRYLKSDEALEARYSQELAQLTSAIQRSIVTHEALSFNPDTHGFEQNTDTLHELKDNLKTIRSLTSFDDNYSFAAANLDELKAEIIEFTESQVTIQGDLASSNGWNDVIKADQVLLAALNTFHSLTQDILAGMPAASGPIESRDGTQAGEESAAIPGSTDANIQTPLSVFGESIDISRKPAGFRSAAPRMVKRLLSHPVGMAFVDPHNQWGGFVRKTGNPKVDYLNSLGYLYKEGVFTPTQLRKFIRHNISKQGRRRHSGWKNAVKYYRRNPVSHKTAENLLIYPHLYKQSTNRRGIFMKNATDKYHNTYITDAISGLSDQYAKSYYAGLKSQYNSKDAKPKADYQELYEVHKEKGSDLIQEAHPEAIVVSDAMGNGGLVENLLEQKSHSEGVAKSAPTGNFRGKHANIAVIEALNKIANQADDDGLFEVSELIESTIKQLF